MTIVQESRREPTTDEMESLFVNNETLDQIKAYLNRFNPIRTMKMERMEIRHSAILAWLLDPNETHGLGDGFLKAFLAESFRGHSSMGKPTALDISQSDLRDAEVRCEWQNIDIFILSQMNQWAFIIENKFNSTQRKGQLADYAEKVRKIFKDHEKQLTARGVFLTLQDEEPADQSYVSIRYANVCEILSRLIKKSSDQLSSEVVAFLKHYLTVIEDATGMSKTLTEMEQLARDLYKQHKKVLDFVIEHGAGSDFAIAARSLFGEDADRFATIQIGNHQFVFSGLNNSTVSFLPRAWYGNLNESNYQWPGCESWWAGFPLIVWLQLFNGNEGTKGTLRLNAEVGPLADHEFRKGLIENIRLAGGGTGLKIGFQKGAADEGKRFSRFLKQNSTQVDDVHNSEKIEAAMKKLLATFQPEFDAVADMLPEFRKYGVLIK